MLSRRLFLGLLGAAAVADPERLLWVPGKKKIFIPKEIVKPKFFWLVRVPRFLRAGGTFAYSPDGGDIGRGRHALVHTDLLWYPVYHDGKGKTLLPPGAEIIHTVTRPPSWDKVENFPLPADRAEGLKWLLAGGLVPMPLDDYKALAPFQPDAHRRRLLQTRP